MGNENIVEISSMCKSFGKKQVFSDFSLSIPAHKITTVFGPSGSGKSTLLNIIGLLENFESGTVRLFGRRIPGTNSRKAMLLRRNEISFLFQNFGLMESRTIRQNLLIGLQYSHLSTKEKNTRMLQALEQTGLDKPLNTHVYNLSGGEQQRVALARVLLKPSRLVLADEPTAGLDAENATTVLRLLREAADGGAAVLIVTHEPEARRYADRTFAMDGGHLSSEQAS